MKIVLLLVVLVVAIVNISRFFCKIRSPLGAPRDPIKRLDMLFTDLGRLVRLSSDPTRPDWKRQAELTAIGKRLQEIEQVLGAAEMDPRYADQARQYRNMMERYRS